MPDEIHDVRHGSIEEFMSRTRSIVHGSPSEWRASYVGESHQSISIGRSTGMNAKSRRVYENRSSGV